MFTTSLSFFLAVVATCMTGACPPAPASQLEHFQTTLKDLCPSPLYQRILLCPCTRTLGQAACLQASPKWLRLLSSKSSTSRAPEITSRLYLEFCSAFFRCISFTFGNTHTTTECLCDTVWCDRLDAAWQPERAAIETCNPLPLQYRNTIN